MERILDVQEDFVLAFDRIDRATGFRLQLAKDDRQARGAPIQLSHADDLALVQYPAVRSWVNLPLGSGSCLRTARRSSPAPMFTAAASGVSSRITKAKDGRPCA